MTSLIPSQDSAPTFFWKCEGRAGSIYDDANEWLSKRMKAFETDRGEPVYILTSTTSDEALVTHPILPEEIDVVALIDAAANYISDHIRHIHYWSLGPPPHGDKFAFTLEAHYDGKYGKAWTGHTYYPITELQDQLLEQVRHYEPGSSIRAIYESAPSDFKLMEAALAYCANTGNGHYALEEVADILRSDFEKLSHDAAAIYKALLLNWEEPLEELAYHATVIAS